MATTYPDLGTQINSPKTGSPPDATPNERMPVSPYPVVLGTAEQDPEIVPPTPSIAYPNPLDLPSQTVVAQTQAGNAFISPNAGGQDGNALSSLIGFLRDTIIGNIILVTVAVTLIVTLAVKIYDWASSGSAVKAQMQNAPGGLSPSMVPTARQALDKYVSYTSELLTAAGIAPTKVITLSNITKLTVGSEIAASARQYATTHATLGPLTGTPLIVIGSAGPTHYSSLNSLNINRFLDTLSEKPTPDTITENSAVMHGLNTQNVEK